MNGIEGGNFWTGFASGAISSIIASGVQLYSDVQNMFNFLGGTGISDNTIKALQIAAGGLSGGISSSISGGNFWAGARQGLITSGLNHVAHSFISKDNPIRVSEKKEEPPTYEYNAKEYESKTALYSAILIDQMAEQFGIKDIIALAAGLDGLGLIDKPFQTHGASKGTSYASKYGSKIFPKEFKTRKFTHFRGGKKMYTKVIGRFLGRMVGPIGWGILAYDVGVTLYKTQTIYNKITAE
jgi:hypothetical protein